MVQENDKLKIPIRYQNMSVSELEKKKDKILKKIRRDAKDDSKAAALPIGKKNISFGL